MDNEFIFDLTQLVKKKILSELKKGKEIKEIIEIGIKLEADALINLYTKKKEEKCINTHEL